MENSTRFSPELMVHLEVPDIVVNVIHISLTAAANGCLLGLEVRVWVVRKRISQPKMLIIFLSVVELLLVALTVGPRLLLYTVAYCDIHTSWLTAMFWMTRFSMACFFNLSKCTVVLLGVERWLSIRAPFYYVRACTLRSFCVAEAALFVYALVIGSLSVFVDMDLFEHVPVIGITHCHAMFLSFEYHAIGDMYHGEGIHSNFINVFEVFSVIQDAILILVLITCNCQVIFGMHVMAKRLKTTSQACVTQLQTMAATGREFSRLMVAIIVVFIVLTLPHMVRMLCHQLDVWPSAVSDFVCQRLALCSGFVNPFLYGLLRKKIRKRASYYLRKPFACCRSNVVTPLDSVGTES